MGKYKYPDELELIMPLVSRKIRGFQVLLQEETERILILKGATKLQLRKLLPGESFIDSNGRRWWKYREQAGLYYSNPTPEEEAAQPQPTDAVLGGTNAQPCPYDAVLGGKSKIQN